MQSKKTTTTNTWESREFGNVKLPQPVPLAAAIEHGVFSRVMDVHECDCITPTAADIESITLEHARELASLLIDFLHLSRSMEQGVSVSTGKKVKTQEKFEQHYEMANRAAEQLAAQYAGMLAEYEGAFGEAATQELDAALKNWCEAVIILPLPKPQLTFQQELFAK